MILKHKNTTVFFTDEGKGEPIVFLHGFLENSSIWHPFIPKLSKHHRIICIDLLGHGQTGYIGYIHTMEMMAEAVYAVLNSLKIEKCTLVGHSMGGYVALAFIENYPSLVNGLLLVNSTTEEDSPERKLNRDRAIAAVKHDHKTFIRIAIANLFNHKNRNKLAQSIEKITQEALNTSLQGIVAALEGMKIRKSRTQLLLEFEHKKWFIISKKDPVLSYKTLIDEAKAVKAISVEFPDGHMSYIENESLFYQNLVHFIEK